MITLILLSLLIAALAVPALWGLLKLSVWGYRQAKENIEHACRRREALREVFRFRRWR